jgi:leader peptidase (prepilin peptidase)/N-methyltransferase
MTPVVTVAAAAAIGAVAGPWLRARIFAHSVAYGRPRRHACPRCHREVAATISARLPATGLCPGCRRRIGPLTGLVEATSAAVLALLAWTSPDAGTFAAAAWIAAFGIVLSFVDSTVHRLPDRLTMPALAGAATILAASAVLTSAYGHLLRDCRRPLDHTPPRKLTGTPPVHLVRREREPAFGLGGSVSSHCR